MIDTPRLLLRPWTESDAAELYRYASDPAIGPITGWLPHQSVEESRQIIRDVLSAPGNFALVLKSTGLPVGCIGIVTPPNGSAPMAEGEAELGYWVGQPYWGQGLMPEAVTAVLAHCFSELHCTGVWCGYYAGNDKSRRVQEKCGFTPRCTDEHAHTRFGEERVEHFTYIARADWAKREVD